MSLRHMPPGRTVDAAGRDDTARLRMRLARVAT
jgi:hypothetical protein